MSRRRRASVASGRASAAVSSRSVHGARAVLLFCSLGLVAAGCTREPSSSTARAPDSAAAAPAPAATPAAAPVPAPAGGTSADAVLKVCADPGNMPLSNRAGEGFQNKIAQTLAAAMGRRLEYEWRTYYQRGLARSTINAGRCDVLMDMNSDFEMGLPTRPLYRSTYVLVTRKGLALAPASLDDPALKQLRIGVFQSSPARQALYDHGVTGDVQYLFYDSSTAPEEHPGKLAERVVAGQLDAAESWGPVAGYYAGRNGLGMVPLNTIDDEVLEYSMAWAVSRKNEALRDALNQAMHDKREEIAAILRDYHVPLVKCEDCVVAGDLASHGPYAPPQAAAAPSAQASSQALAQLQLRIADGADPNQELAHAIDAGDGVRVAWLLRHGAKADRPNLLGEPPLHQAIRNQAPELVGELLAAGARVDSRDGSDWTPLMKAAWSNDTRSVSQLLGRRAKVDTVAKDGWTALDLAISYADAGVVQALIDAGADVRRSNPAGFTPVMFAVARNDVQILDALLARGAAPDQANRAGVTPLMLAAAAGREAIVRRLLQAGARPDTRDAEGKTPAALAQQRGNAPLAQLLTEAEQRRAQ